MCTHTPPPPPPHTHTHRVVSGLSQRLTFGSTRASDHYYVSGCGQYIYKCISFIKRILPHHFDDPWNTVYGSTNLHACFDSEIMIEVLNKSWPCRYSDCQCLDHYFTGNSYKHNINWQQLFTLYLIVCMFCINYNFGNTAYRILE